MRTLYLLALATVASCSGPDGRGGSDTITIHLPSAPRALVAFRDGEGAWTVTTAMPTLTFSAYSGHYTVVIGCHLDDERHVLVYAATNAELSTVEYQRECGPERQRISGQVSGFGTAQGATIFAGLRIAVPALPNSPSFAIGAPRGIRDLVATRRTNFGADRVFIRRGVSVDASPVMADIDFDGSNAVGVVTHPITFAETTTTRPTVYSWFWTQGGTWINSPLHVDTAGFAFGVPSSALLPGDLHVMQIEDTLPMPGLWRSITWAVHDLAERTISMPSASEGAASVSAVNQASGVGVAFNWPTAPDAPLYRFGVRQGYVFMEAVVSRDAFVSPEYAMPDLTGVVGWDTSPLFDPSTALDWWASADTGSTLDQMTLMLPTEEVTIFRTGWKGQASPQ